ncbi:Aste57867_20449 [Aphanomyces stellatus]|uniref:Aste57867_20449 protein n=1 Tax=Aphanomyces stellatus TaxID=120398 RepID=A0A485LEZ4_9STRA|nr:hypothetical protein As57867_020383 [Aphanomyces stellatus]VFT97135.1 Aste57867_20449 [Aphanomyces stellatus]
MRQLFRPTTCTPTHPSPPNPASTNRHVRIVLDKAIDLPVGDSALAGGSSDPYVVFQLGDHVLRSAVVNHSLEPSWRREQYEFILTEDEWRMHSTLRIRVMDFDVTTADDHLGAVTIELGDWTGATTLAQMTIQPYAIIMAPKMAHQKVHPELHVGIAVLSEAEATELFIMQIWEHERWGAIKGWSHDHLHTMHDPHTWASDSSPTGGATFTDAVVDAPDGYKPATAWEFKVALGDADGWLYASKFDGPSWHDQPLVNSVVRRRLWARQYSRHLVTVEPPPDVLVDNVAVAP